MSVVYGEQQRTGSALGGSGSAPYRELERQYHVVLQDSLGHPALGFREGTWFRLTVSGAQPLQLRGAIRTCPHAAGSIVQIACWWMRENPLQPRSLDLATELALTVGELVRVCPADGLGSTSMDLLPMAMAAVAQSTPPASTAPALPAASSAYGSSSSYAADPLGSSGYSSVADTTNGYSSSNGGYSSSNDGYSSSNGYSGSAGTTNGYSSTSSSADAYSGSTSAYSGSTSAYGDASGAADGYGTGSYAADPLQGAYSSTPTYANGTSYDAAQTSYLPAATSATPATSLSSGWFEPADGTGTGGFPKVPPAPVVGRTPAPSASTPPAAKPYPPSPAPAQRGYGATAQPQAALPAAHRGYSEGADWDPRPAAPRRPSHQARPQQAAAPRPAVPAAPAAPAAPAHAANGQAPRPRPQQPRDDFERRMGLSEQQDPGRSSDRNPGPPRRPNAAAQPRGTMGRRPASRPGRPSEY